MRVCFVTSEVHPFSKTGGLADVSQALPAALAERGAEVTVITPLYRSALETCTRLGLPRTETRGPTLWIGSEQHRVRYHSADHDGCRYVFVGNDAFYGRPTLYVRPEGGDYLDNVARFAFFSRAALEYWRGGAPDVFHLNDWQTALAPLYLHTTYERPPLAGTPSVLTIHNLAYQGMWPAPQLYATGLDWSVFHTGALEFYGHINLLKGGLVFADALTTVSPSYAEEIQQPAFGNGLDGVLRAHRHKLRGILNGIDTRRWDPAADPLLTARYSATDLSGKAACKRALQTWVGLPPRDDAFLLGSISRFDVQKGMALIADAARIVAPLPVQIVVLGSGDAALEERMRALAAAYPRQVAVIIGFDEPLAHLIEAGADAFLMPSAYEPCGLNQMYSQRYGTIPIVHAVGGLKDTVNDYSPQALADRTPSGFTFTSFEASYLAEAILRAWRLFNESPDAWRRLMTDCMALDHSWTRSAAAYLELYSELTMRPR